MTRQSVKKQEQAVTILNARSSEASGWVLILLQTEASGLGIDSGGNRVARLVGWVLILLQTE